MKYLIGSLILTPSDDKGIIVDYNKEKDVYTIVWSEKEHVWSEKERYRYKSASLNTLLDSLGWQIYE